MHEDRKTLILPSLMVPMNSKDFNAINGKKGLYVLHLRFN